MESAAAETARRPPLLRRENLIAAAIVAGALGVGSLVLQRYVAETRGAAIAIVAGWYLLVGTATWAYVRSRPQLRLAALGTVAAVVVATVAIGYWTGFRDTEVDEDVVVASAAASETDREAGLAGSATEGVAGGDGSAEAAGGPAGSGGGAASGPVSLASGTFAGADGHAGSGTAEVIESPGGVRTLTFTDFDVDPGAAVEVYLTPSTDSVDDRVELGGLKGNVGDQQYEIPPDADLRRYDSVVLWCTPFTVRIATAELS